MNPTAALPLGAALALALVLERSHRTGTIAGSDLLQWLVPQIVRARAARVIERVGAGAEVDPERLAALAWIAGLAGGVAGAVVAWGSALVVVVPALVGGGAFLFPFRLLEVRALKRRQRVLRELPDTLDLMAICVGSGMALDPALRMAAERFPGIVSDEFERLFRELALGARRVAAYRELAERLGTDEARSLSASLVQAETLGLPLAEALAEQAETMRGRREQMAREHAARAAPRVQLVIALVVVPGAMIFILGALLLQLADQLAGLGGLG